MCAAATLLNEAGDEAGITNTTTTTSANRQIKHVLPRILLHRQVCCQKSLRPEAVAAFLVREIHASCDSSFEAGRSCLFESVLAMHVYPCLWKLRLLNGPPNCRFQSSKNEMPLDSFLGGRTLLLYYWYIDSYFVHITWNFLPMRANTGTFRTSW